MRIEYFQLIDRIVALSAAERTIDVEARVPETSTIFEGHFPGHPLMPGVLLTESMAQTSGWLLIALNRFAKMPFLSGVKDAKFRQFVTPGETLRVSASLVHDGSGYAVTAAKIQSGGKTVADATLTFRVVDFPDRSFEQHMREAAGLLHFPFGEFADA